MNIVIPLGGIGERFRSYGFLTPKPLIKAAGKEIILRVLDSLKIKKNDNLFIVYNYELDKYNFSSYLNKYKNLNLIRLNTQTKGPLETLSYLKDILFLKKFSNQKLLIVDGDTFYRKNIINIVRKKKNSCIFYSVTNNKNPIYSYIKIKDKNKVIDIKEKKKISDFFNTGAYFFNSTKEFYNIALRIVKNNKFAFISDVYDYFLKKKNILIEGIFLKKNDFFVLGTPKELIKYSSLFYEKKRFCFDLDNTLVTFPKKKGDYSTCDPIYHNIRYLNFLKEKGHYIIIFTARRMKTFNGNIKKVIKNIKKITLKQLQKFNIKYDELIFGKPYADFYIDDLAINSRDNINFNLGFYEENENLSRVNNDILIGERVTKKTSQNKKIQFEAKYLSSLPEDLKNYFPNTHVIGKDYYTMDTVHGVDFNTLAELNLLEKKHLTQLLNVLKIMHNKKVPHETLSNYNPLYYKNYLTKFLDRKKFLDKDIILKYDFFFNKIEDDLRTYEKKKLAKIGIIHGDPIFSNVILNEKNKIVLIDPRGCHGNQFSMYGDIHYDYAKVYQSLLGYEFILNDMAVPKKFQKLMIFFEQFLNNKNCLNIVKKLTAALYVSLIPLHKNINPKRIIEFILKKY